MRHFEATAQRLQNAYTTVWTGTPAEATTPADVVPAQSAPEPASVVASASKRTSPEVQPVAPVSESMPEQPGAERAADSAPSTVNQIADVLRSHSTGSTTWCAWSANWLLAARHMSNILGASPIRSTNYVSVSSVCDGRRQRLRRSTRCERLVVKACSRRRLLEPTTAHAKQNQSPLLRNSIFLSSIATASLRS